MNLVLVKKLDLLLVDQINIIRQAFHRAVGHEQIKSLDGMLFGNFNVDHG
jgi:hypothetical protein